MSAPDTRGPSGPRGPDGEDREFGELLKGHVNRELTAVEAQRLLQLGAADRVRSERVREVEQLHSLFEQERQLFGQVAAPAEPAEEADESFQRLQRAAAEAEQALRARLLHPVRPLRLAVRPRRTSWVLLSAAAVLIAVFLVFRSGGEPPELLPGPPENRTLGELTRIPLITGMDAENHSVAWLAIAGARTYEVRVEDADGNLVLRRADDEARSIRWDLTEAQFQLLKQARAPLILRVVARDGDGITVGTTGDLPLPIR